jgi:hypothetical protein
MEIDCVAAVWNNDLKMDYVVNLRQSEEKKKWTKLVMCGIAKQKQMLLVMCSIVKQI